MKHLIQLYRFIFLNQNGRDTYTTINKTIVSKLFDLIKMDIKKTRDIICHF